MKKTVLLLGLMAVAASASAQSSEPTSRVYGEVGYHHLDVDVAGTGWNSQMLSGTVGYQFHPNLSAELFLAGGLNTDTKGSPRGEVGVKVDNAYGVFLRPSVKFSDKVTGFVRLGYINASISASVARVGSFSDSGSLWVAAPGINVDFTPRVYGQVSWMLTSTNNMVKANGPSVALGVKF